MRLDDSRLHRITQARLADLDDDLARKVAARFELLRQRIAMESQAIQNVFPEYTPHDEAHHLAHLFHIADVVLGEELLARLNCAELILLEFGLLTHDWGMAVSTDERTEICASQGLHEERNDWARFYADATALGRSLEESWPDYVRGTHAARSGRRIRRELDDMGATFANAVARAAEGHGLDLRIIRDPEQYHRNYPLFNQVVDLAAVATYVRVFDLLDVADDRTPYALWRFINPRDPKSAGEWRRHHAIGGVGSELLPSGLKQLVVSATVEDVETSALIEDLRSWVDREFSECVAFLRQLADRYQPHVDSHLYWSIDAHGFEPVRARFHADERLLFDLLSKEIYGRERFVFLRELLQNSIDALDSRAALFAREGAVWRGSIDVSIGTTPDGSVTVKWRDDGIGMDVDKVTHYLAKIGSTWYGSDDYKRAHIDANPISRFGIGLLSCFRVTDAMEIVTQQDPGLRGDSPALSIRIPDKYRHFHIRRVAPEGAGTVLSFVITPTEAAAPTAYALHRNTHMFGHVPWSYLAPLNADTIVAYLREIAGFLRHDLQVHLADDDRPVPIVPMSLVALREAGWQFRPASMERAREDVDPRVWDSVTVDSFEIGDEAGPFNGICAIILPKNLDSLRRIDSPGDSRRRFRDERQGIEFSPRALVGGSEVFVKGIKAGSLQLLSVRHSDWPNARVFLNVSKPALVEPNVARDSIVDIGGDLVRSALGDISAHLRSRLLQDGSKDVGDHLHRASRVLKKGRWGCG